MGPLDKYILREDALSSNEKGIGLRFQSHWYRALPLSCMDFTLKVNGVPVNDEEVEVEINGVRFPKNKMLELKDEWLFILDKATVHVPMEDPPKKGESCLIDFKLDLYIPYILIGPEQNPLLAGTLVTKKLVCQ
ncbi:C-glycoside deglycosidase beta subunit domain-containing protein [Maribacter sp. CXY002]|uniref:C-glycoside deglycosidase beta subunit domain-containing protein n=1 Tax=Maribacter luteocoastalis TaxID=3407671 RepID=UPI003B683E7A